MCLKCTRSFHYVDLSSCMTHCEYLEAYLLQCLFGRSSEEGLPMAWDPALSEARTIASPAMTMCRRESCDRISLWPPGWDRAKEPEIRAPSSLVAIRERSFAQDNAIAS